MARVNLKLKRPINEFNFVYVEIEPESIGYARVRHGEWVLTDYADGQTYSCSQCGELWTFIFGTPEDNGANFCPNCGATMDGDS